MRNRSGLAISRRTLLGNAALAGLALSASPAGAAQKMVDLLLPGRPGQREYSDKFPQKGTMIVQRTRPPLLETPIEVFDKDVFTPNKSFFVRWHWAQIPTEINPEPFRLNIHGLVNTPASLSLKDIIALPQFRIAAVNQCSGNSRGFCEPPVPGAQWANGAMGNARWTGVRLRDVLDRAGIARGALQVRFKGMDEALVPGAPGFMKSLSLEHARDGEVMIAYAMNGEQLPLLNGFPLRLVVPGWYSTYWVKMLNDIELLGALDDNFWMAKAYTIPDTPHADMVPSQAGVKMVPINRMVPRSFVTNINAGMRIPAGKRVLARGIAFGGDTGVAQVEVSIDGGKSWHMATLGPDEGKYSLRRWTTYISLSQKGDHALLVRCTNDKGEVQPDTPNWNPSGFMRNAIEATNIIAV